MASVAEYTRMAQMLQLIPASSANAAAVDYEMRTDLTQTESTRFELSVMVCLLLLLLLILIEICTTGWVPGLHFQGQGQATCGLLGQGY